MQDDNKTLPSDINIKFWSVHCLNLVVNELYKSSHSANKRNRNIHNIMTECCNAAPIGACDC